MSSNDRTPRWEPTWRQLGAGHSVTFRCCDCGLPRGTLGRKKTATGWRCVHCVRIKDAQKAAA